jgi:hypothetical protein
MVLIWSPRPWLRSLIAALAIVFTIFFTVGRLGSGIQQLYMPKRRLYLEGINGDDLARQVDFWKRLLGSITHSCPRLSLRLRG